MALLSKICSLAFILLYALSSFSQGGFKSYSIEEGLPQSQVSSISQDNKGYMWFGTAGGGVARFDGRKFTSFTTEQGLAGNHVNAVLATNDGSIWIGTDKGLNIFNGKTIIPLPETLKTLSNLNIRVLYRAPSGEIWIGTSQGAFKYNGSSLSPNETLKREAVISIFQDSKTNMWFGTGGSGIFRFRKNGFIQYNTLSGLPSNTVNSITEDKNGAILAGTEKGVAKLSNHIAGPGDTSSIFVVNNKLESLNHSNIKVLFRDKAGNIGIGTIGEGVYKFDGNNYISFSSREGLSSDDVLTIFEDRESNVWLGTDGGGVLKFTISPFNSISMSNGLAGNVVLSIEEDRKGNYWFGTHKGVSKLSAGNLLNPTPDKFTHYDKLNGLSNDKVWSIKEDSTGNIWIATYGAGVFIFDGKKFINYTEKDGLGSNNVRSVLHDSKGNTWVGTGKGVNKFTGKKMELFRVENGLLHDRIFTMFEDNAETIWFGTGGGLSSYDGVKFTNYSEKDGLKDKVVTCIVQDKNGDIWFSTFGGIGKVELKTGKIKTLTTKDGLRSNTVYVVVSDGFGNLLMGSNNGIDMLNIDEFNNEGKISIKHFGKEEGFTGIECNSSSYYKDKKGNIWFGTIKGAFKYNPKHSRSNIQEPMVHIENIRLFFQDVDWSEYAKDFDTYSGLPSNLKLGYDNNHLTFDFSGVTMIIPEKVKFKFKLEGFDENWSPGSVETFATYSNLPPGKYVFKVKAANNDGIWNKDPVSFSFKIAAPFWKTWWFYLLAGVLFVSLIYSIIQYRLSSAKKAAQALKMQVDIKTSQLREEKEIVEKQKKEIEQKNDDITASIKYAKRIQDAVLPNKDDLKKILPASFILFKPRDIVSGDFYWFTSKGDKTVVAVADCTGHGVPGAFMSLIGIELLDDIISHEDILEPAQILKKLHERLVVILKKDKQDSGTVDGMDIILCVIDKKTNTLEFSSTGRPLVLIRDNKLEMIKNGKYPLGIILKKERKHETHKLSLMPEDSFYIFTDGYCDQFGGADNEKLMYGRFHELLLKIHTQEIAMQALALEKNIEQWRGGRRQLDDILVVGVKV